MKTDNTTDGKTSKQVTTILDEIVNIERGMWFVTMTDKFLSGWGCAQNKIAKRVYICKDHQQAAELYSRIIARQPKCEMTHVNTTPRMPYYSPSKYFVSWVLYSDSEFNY
jgi:hypothetical protein